MPFWLLNSTRNLYRRTLTSRKMSSATNFAPATVVPGRLTGSQLRDKLLDPKESEKIAVIDVRDDGLLYISHIYICIHSDTKPDHIGGHIKNSVNVPSSTLDHALPSLVRKLADKETVVFHCALSQVRGPKAAARYMRERERILADAPTDQKKEQKVVVLDRGFEGWQEVYGKDKNLTEEYDEKLWSENY